MISVLKLAAFCLSLLPIASFGCNEEEFLELYSREPHAAYQLIKDCEDLESLSVNTLSIAAYVVFLPWVEPELADREKYLLRMSYVRALALRLDVSSIEILVRFYRYGVLPFDIEAQREVGLCLERINFNNLTRADVEECLSLSPSG